MNKTKHNAQTRLNCGERLMYLNEIAATKAACEDELRAKDEIIAYYRRAAELATRSKHRALNRQDEQRKDIVAYAVCAAFVAFAIWLGGTAIHTFLLWASGR